MTPSLRLFLPALGLLALLSGPAHAQVSAHDAWARATVAQQKATGVFMQLTAAQDARLVQVQSPVAGVAEVHEMVQDGDIMRMRPLPDLSLGAGQTVGLRPGGLHIMLMDLKQPIAAGSTLPLTLVFEGKDGSRQTLEVQAQVRALGAGTTREHHSAGHH